jgi:hypothetical protein
MASRGPFRYRLDVLAVLPEYGILPRPETPPELAREFVSDMYRHQLKQLRRRLLDQEFPRSEYADRVIALRDRYRVLSLRAHEWVERDQTDPPTA